jgi:TfoX/Sxy family transcriptional regulator of competence genes
MAYSEALADRIRDALGGRRDVEERKMFGGIAFMVGGHMCVGIVDRSLMVRLAAEDAVTLLARPHVRPMDFTGRPMKGFLYVDPPGLTTSRQLTGWIARAVAFGATLPPKKPRARRLPRRRP